MANAWFISEIYDHDELIMCDEIDFDEDPQPIPTNRIQVRRSPYFDVFLGHHTVRLTINSGSTGNMMRASAATYLNAIVTRSSQSAHQANGSSSFKVIGETRLTFTRDNQKLQFEWLVVEILDSEVLVGIPFMKNNDISIRPSRCQVLIGNYCVYQYRLSPAEIQRHTVARRIYKTIFHKQNSIAFNPVWVIWYPS